MKILHVTESLAAGVGHYLTLVTRGQVQAGHEVVLAHSIRDDTPLLAVLDEQYSGVQRVVLPMVTSVSPWRDLLGVIDLMKLYRREKPDVIHLHSSKAGVLGRVAAKLSVFRGRVLYSPHGFAFLREDVSPRKQKLFLWFEQIAAKLGGILVACSATESALAKEEVKHPHVVLVENATDLDAVPLSRGVAGKNGQEVLVLNSGRVCYQKAPWLFRKVAEQCADLPARFLWMGAGDLSTKLVSKHPDTNLGLTGWLSRTQIAGYLKQGSVFLMPSLWEGMPLALIEAQAAGIPAVVSNVVGCKDVVIDGVTGFVCDHEADMLARVRQLIADPGLRERMGHNAAEMARNRFSVTRLNEQLIDLYAAPNE